MGEAVQRTAIVRHTEVVKVPAHLPPDGLPKVREPALIPLLAQPLVDGDERPPQALL